MTQCNMGVMYSPEREKGAVVGGSRSDVPLSGFRGGQNVWAPTGVCGRVVSWEGCALPNPPLREGVGETRFPRMFTSEHPHLLVLSGEREAPDLSLTGLQD